MSAVPRDGTIRDVAVRIGDQVSLGSILVALEPDDSAGAVTF